MLSNARMTGYLHLQAEAAKAASQTDDRGLSAAIEASDLSDKITTLTELIETNAGYVQSG